MFIKKLKSFMIEREVGRICKEYSIRNYSINDNGLVDVDGSVTIYGGIRLDKIPLKFGRVDGNFDCARNNLKSLEGCPEWINGSFNCEENNLTSLKGCPKYIRYDFLCMMNKLTSLEGCEDGVYQGQFICSGNPLKNFRGFPQLFKESFLCYGSPVYEIYRLNPLPEFADLLNEYDVIRSGDRIVETRLRQALEDSNCEKIPDVFQFENYELI